MNINTLKQEAREEFASTAQLTENPIEDNGAWIDGSFYQIYKGNLESFLDSLIDKVVSAVEESVVPEKTEYPDINLTGTEAEERKKREFQARTSGYNSCRLVVLEAFRNFRGV